MTPHFTLEELCFSELAERLGIDNTPPPSVAHTLQYTLSCMEEVRRVLNNKPVIVTSGYRCDKVNEMVGGNRKGQHPKGEAVDFRCPAFGTPYEVAKALSESDIDYDQLIYEGSWVHISFKKGANRRQTLTAKFISARPVYYTGLVQ